MDYNKTTGLDTQKDCSRSLSILLVWIFAMQFRLSSIIVSSWSH